MNQATQRISLQHGRIRTSGRVPHSVVRGKAAFLICLMVAALIGLSPGSGVGVAAQDVELQDSAAAAAGWLLDQRLDDGAFPGFTGEGDPGLTVDAVLALSAAGMVDELDQSLAYLEGEALVFAQIGPGSAAKLALALAAAGRNPHDFATVNPLSIVEHAAAGGEIGFGPYDHALGLLALAAGGSEIPDQAIDVVFDTQSEAYGWSFDGSSAEGAADSNTTALMIQAAYAAGIGDDERIAAALDWLVSLQADDGGMPYHAGEPSDANSTALAIQALIAAGQETHETVRTELQETLVAFQNENGSISWLLDPRDENIFSTVQVIPALVGAILPVHVGTVSGEIASQVAA